MISELTKDHILRYLFEQSFKRQRNYFERNYREQFEIDEKLNMLDYNNDLSEDDNERFLDYEN